MEAIENAAYVSVGRASAFAGLGIVCIMFGLAFDPVLATRTGGGLCLMVGLILAAFGWRARYRSYKRTELWLILDKKERPPAGIAQKVIAGALREAYLWFAQQAALIALVLLATAVGLKLMGLTGYDF
ncbi:MAG: hypothetical protein OER56_03715 [Hyphomicrobiales bacterium]|nr:hypothetical protein [Hyphomicrobiales bacterium]